MSFTERSDLLQNQNHLLSSSIAAFLQKRRSRLPSVAHARTRRDRPALPTDNRSGPESNSNPRQVVRLALLAWGVGGIFGVAQAQESVEATGAALEEVVITGSRIQRTGMDTPTPVTAVTSTELRDMAPGQLIDALNQLPQFLGNMTPQSNAWWNEGAAGGLNLRGAGRTRTLVLLDGRRVTPSNRLGVANISDLPEPVIQRVETVTGGASAAYGTDAVAGVVNFTLDTEFTGLDVRLRGGRTGHSDGDNVGMTLAYGTGIGDRLHLLVSGDYYHHDGVGGLGAIQKRDFYKQRARITNPDPDGPAEIIRPFVSPTNFSHNGIINAPGSELNKMQFFREGDEIWIEPLEFSGVGQLEGACNCQAEPQQTYGVDTDTWIIDEHRRQNAFSYLSYDVSDNIDVYFQGMFSESYTERPWVGMTHMGPWEPRIFSGNPFLPSEIQEVMDREGLDSFGFGLFGLNNPSTPLGTYTVNTENRLLSGTVGFDAQLGNGGLFDGGLLGNWRARGYVQYGENRQLDILHNGIRTDTTFLGLDAVRNPDTGAIECRAAVVNPEAFGDCVPINLFGGVQHLSREEADYILHPGTREVHAFTDHGMAEVLLDGDISEGWGAGPISMAVGGSYRRDSMRSFVPDLRDEFVHIQGENTGFRGLVPEDRPNGMLGVRPGSVPGGYLGDSSISMVLFTATVQNETASTSGAFNVTELFSEVNIPLLSQRPIARQLDFNVAARWADFSGSGTIWAWKYGLSWQVNDDLRIRGTGSRDVRAATLRERFERTGTGASIQDPELDGVRYSSQSRVGGNPTVAPETADTFTIGGIYQPSFIPGLGLSVDWYHIDLDGAITQLGNQQIVDLCFEGAEDMCAFITRDPDTNRIVNLDRLFTNVDNRRISGVDVEMRYGRDVNWFGAGGALSARLLGTWLGESSIKSPGAPRDDSVGQIGGVGLPEFNVIANLGYTVGPFRAHVQGRWIDGGVLDRRAVEGVTIDNNRVSSVFYTNLRLSYSAPFTAGEEWEVFGHVTNLFDREPPPVPGGVGRTGTSDFNQSLHDTLGRRFVVGVNLRF